MAGPWKPRPAISRRTGTMPLVSCTLAGAASIASGTPYFSTARWTFTPRIFLPPSTPRAKQLGAEGQVRLSITMALGSAVSPQVSRHVRRSRSSKRRHSPSRVQRASRVYSMPKGMPESWPMARHCMPQKHTHQIAMIALRNAVPVSAGLGAERVGRPRRSERGPQIHRTVLRGTTPVQPKVELGRAGHEQSLRWSAAGSDRPVAASGARSAKKRKFSAARSAALLMRRIGWPLSRLTSRESSSARREHAGGFAGPAGAGDAVLDGGPHGWMSGLAAQAERRRQVGRAEDAAVHPVHRGDIVGGRRHVEDGDVRPLQPGFQDEGQFHRHHRGTACHATSHNPSIFSINLIMRLWCCDRVEVSVAGAK